MQSFVTVLLTAAAETDAHQLTSSFSPSGPISRVGPGVVESESDVTLQNLRLGLVLCRADDDRSVDDEHAAAAAATETELRGQPREVRRQRRVDF